VTRSTRCRVRRAVEALVLGSALVAGAADGARAADPDGKALYAAECAKCHGATGAADTPVGKAMKVASLQKPELAAAEGPAHVVEHVRSDSKHSAVSKKLGDPELAAIAAFVQTLAAGK
jgi:mono/diheme cytochrome c family protein